MNDGMTNDERSSVLRLPFSDQPFPRPARHERGEGRGEGHVTIILSPRRTRRTRRILSRRGAEARRFLSRSRRGQEADPEPVTAAFKLRDFSHHEGPEDHEERHTHELIFPQNLVGPSVVVRLLLHLKRKRACTLVFRTADVLVRSGCAKRLRPRCGPGGPRPDAGAHWNEPWLREASWSAACLRRYGRQAVPCRFDLHGAGNRCSNAGPEAGGPASSPDT